MQALSRKQDIFFVVIETCGIRYRIEDIEAIFL